ncbi:histidinol dehydrogenase [Solirubrobacter sp. CPCC 204708]|uniref:Histidinol dehydrogenase n=1 Tax=Solirubrobacter deserti TaxID=2282478 RepID=A0ABT4RT16_9ACTN|nr:histidinol dehydrogenase [Solirubrobacter deserti]MBE2315093.1 histidinol dehydrogenase [Solirubrobacter deserti]MDA0141385.1 histidinol dehydrogenase [Solirubrobacter deserti]
MPLTPEQRAAEIRASVPPGASVAEDVATIIRHVRKDGDLAVEEMEAEVGAGLSAPFTPPPGALPDDVRAGLLVAIENVRAVAEAGVDEPRTVTLPQGHTVTLREEPVRRAAVYAPGGRNPYPSTVVMGVVTARAAGVDEVYVVGAPHPVMVAAAELCGADGYFAVTGAQAVAALAYGTGSIPAVDVIVGPGSLWVQEAKRQVSGVVGIDGFAGPSDLTVVATEGADLEVLAADIAGQAEHGEGSLTVAVSDNEQILSSLNAQHDVLVATMDEALAFVEALAPEHLQLAGADAEALAPRIRSAGCLFVGSASGTAFGDYVAGSNHVLPTEGAARFASGLNVRHFRRRMAEVRVGDAGAALAAAGVPIAEAESFALHAASMSLRNRSRPAP